MEFIARNAFMLRDKDNRKGSGGPVMNLAQGSITKEYVIKGINTDDKEIKDFLFTLGCYEGETVTVISKLADNYVITVKDARYSIDKELAEAIII